MPALHSILTRRRLIGISLAAGGLAAWRAGPLAAAIEAATPAQTAGPFYPTRKPLDGDNDLTVVDGRPDRAEGTPMHIIGRVLDRGGRPVRGARVEIWQCNAFGRYHHPRDPGRAPLDPAFQGWGADVTGDDGGYRFKTIQPPPYPASADWMRPAHVHFTISGPGFERLTTQMYFEGDPYLADDFVFNRIADPEARARVVVALEARTGLDAAVAPFDVVLPA